jgi:membrane protein YqaA with SNARE-associated domain
MITRRRLLLGLAFVLLAATVVSLTIGQDLFNNRRPDLVSFGLVNFAGYLFFIVLPVELLVPWYLAEGHRALDVVPLAVVTALVAQAVDYGIGRLFSTTLVEALMGERRLRASHARIERWGGLAIFAFNVTPLSSPVLLAAAGVVRYHPVKAFLWSATGLSVKYAFIAWALG